MDIPTLNLINNEISRLATASVVSGLTLEEVRKLEILIKTRQLILGEPTSRVDINSNDKETFTNADILKVLSGGK